ncbi:MAG: hypothetical protein EBR09_17025 [Proteobacteria bacterium]|nr:hypothetical protein [Pseudomonadota bacterium]
MLMTTDSIMKKMKSDFLNFSFPVRVIYVFSFIGSLRWTLYLLYGVLSNMRYELSALVFTIVPLISFLLTLAFLHLKPNLVWLISLLLCLSFYMTGVSTFGFLVTAFLRHMIPIPLSDQSTTLFITSGIVAFLAEVFKTWILFTTFSRREKPSDK